MNDTICDDYRNGKTALPEVDALMTRLLQYDDSDYHPEDPTGEYVVPLRKWVKNELAVFPGGNGVLGDLFPVGGIMALANDFDALHHYEVGVEHGYSSNGEIIEKLMQRMLDAISPGLSRRAWMTNFCMGVRVAPDQYGISPAWKHPPFRAMCGDFFLHCLTVQKPRLIIALGANVPVYLASVSNDLAAWKSNRFNDRGVTRARFRNGYECTLISNMHPALRGPNVRFRKYAGLTGDAAEMRLLRDALRQAELE